MRRYYKIRDLAPATIERIGGFDVVSSHVPPPRPFGRRRSRCDRRAGDSAPRLRARGGSGIWRRAARHRGRRSLPDGPRRPICRDCRRARRARVWRRTSTRPTLPPAIRRVAVIAVHPEPAWPPSCSRSAGPTRRARSRTGCRRATLAGSQRFAEDRKFRGLHPMISRRLQMWRLSNFEISRLPSVDDVYAYDCVARENPADRRLVAVAEIRGLTPVRDDERTGRGDPRGRAGARRLPRRDSQRPGRRPAAGAARLEPRHALHLAGGRPPVRRDQRHRQAPDAADRGPRSRAGGRQRSTAAAGIR